MKNEQRFPVALLKCFLCGGDGDIIIGKRATSAPEGESKVEKMHGKIMHTEPCGKCKEYMKQGVIIITIDPEKSGDKIEDAWRTGGWFVVKENAVKRMAEVSTDEGKKAINQAISKRVLFMAHDIAETLGLFDLVKK